MRFRLVAALVALGLAVAGCGGDGGGGEGGGRLTVLAASSLSESFGELGRRFEADHPGAAVTFSFAASSSLSRQVVEGAPADVLATADEESMQRAVDAGAVGVPVVFARNRLEIVIEAGNPLGIMGLADLARPGLTVVLCAPEVPCGRYAAEALDRLGVAIEPASEEENVKGVMAKVTLGEADAGIVYATDIIAAGDKASGVTIPAEQNVLASYPIAALSAASHPVVAQAWVDFVVSPVGRLVLARSGFLLPPP